MTVESNNFYTIAIIIAVLSDWLKSLYPVFQQMRSKTKTSPVQKLGIFYCYFNPILQPIFLLFFMLFYIYFFPIVNLLF